MGRKVEVLFRDDQLKPAVGAQRTKELIENDKALFIVGGLAAHVQMAINEQTKKSKVLYISTSQSDEISAKPDGSPITFHEALNPDHHVPGHGQVGGAEPRQEVVDHLRGLRVGQAVQRGAAGDAARRRAARSSAPPRIRSAAAEFSAHLPKIQAAKPDVLMNVAPGADNIALLKQVISFGMKKTMKMAQPLLWISYLKEGGPELYQDVHGVINWYWELQDSIPHRQEVRRRLQKKFNLPPGRLRRVLLQRRARGGPRRGARQVHRRGRGRERAAQEPDLRPLQGQAVVAGVRQQVDAGPLDRQGPRTRPRATGA